MRREEYRNNEIEDEGIICGRNPVFEALKAERNIEKILIADGSREGLILKIIAMAREKGIPVVTTRRESLDKMFTTKSHQGIAAYVTQKEYSTVEEILDYAYSKNQKPFLVIADEISDPHNLGAIIRSADCAGAHGVIIQKRRSCGMTSTVYKSSAGAAEHMKIARVTNLNDTVRSLKKAGVFVFGTDGMGDRYYYDTDYDCPVAIVIGSEGEGMSRLMRESCDMLLKIPMFGKINSLNASCAAAIVLMECAKFRSLKNI
ncbi:MAG: 23S rRNA (guanosine(2251)-2'-O)-methyltransferase RlmB [Ruminococcaceae bacterium]|nr:23S rRNA (guanosine(2251)-2'-O)-methyltransferase RlmB [Oscillospiraceae bacterium]